MSGPLIPSPFDPTLVIDGERQEEKWGLVVNDHGFLCMVHKSSIDAPWRLTPTIPPKLAGYVDLFIAQNYWKLNNHYGLPGPPSDSDISGPDIGGGDGGIGV